VRIIYEKQVTIRNKTGLHARPAADFVACAGKFSSHITISHAGEPDDAVNAKSIIMLLTLGLGQGAVAEIRAEGPDEKEAVDTLAALIDRGFGEN